MAISRCNFRKILIANRGEIAIRILRTCRELGIQPMVVYCQGEENSLPVQMADQAYCLGPPIAGFLNPKLLVQIAKRSGCQAIHPGYGFLSEQASFARACRAQGIRFIGPSPETLALAGHKIQARRTVAQTGIPTVPGTMNVLNNLPAAKRAARSIGYPMILKSAYGGGGKGMQIARNPSELGEFFPIMQEESLRSFGRSGIFLEKYIRKAQHIEVQILADLHGNTVHLGERNCSIQRRHQKLLEEAPCPGLKKALREKLFSHTLRTARLFRYTGAGTVEFLVDADDRIYFLEVNARIQVEHGVTELLTGLDLVAEQIRIAQGLPLLFAQKDIAFRGHAIECRIYAEDPFDHFSPSAGTIDYLSLPQGPGVRVDTASTVGTVVDTRYDALIAKVLAHGSDRTIAMRKMQTALEELLISPIRTTAPLFLRILADKGFLQGRIHTELLRVLNMESVHPQHQQLGLVLASLLTQGGQHVPEPQYIPAPLISRRFAWNPWRQ